jgi:hypothetical protein
MIRTILKFAVVLLVVGEIVVRFDEHTLLFQEGRNQILANVYKDTEERYLIDSGRMHITSNDLRIMLLGDSKLYGAGVRPEKGTGAVIRTKLKRESGGRRVYLLDLTEPGNNMWGNRRAFVQYLDAFSPQVVILAYNHNDVYGDQGEVRTANRTPGPVPPIGSTIASPPRRDGFLDVVKSAKQLLANSHSLEFVLVKLNMELKLAGIVVPGTEFDHLINHSHVPDYPGWVASQKHLTAMAEVCRARHITLILYVVPELEMLPRYAVFTDLDRYLMSYCEGLQVRCRNGIEPFRNRRGETFALSRYDGHPNEAASEIMADDLLHEIRSTFLRAGERGTGS